MPWARRARPDAGRTGAPDASSFLPLLPPGGPAADERAGTDPGASSEPAAAAEPGPGWAVSDDPVERLLARQREVVEPVGGDGVDGGGAAAPDGAPAVGPRRPGVPPWAPFLVAALVLGAVVLAAAWRGADRDVPDGMDATAVRQAAVDAVQGALEERDRQPENAVAVYRTIVPSLVVVQTERAAGPGADLEGGRGLGAGVVVNADGTVLTALHVVEGATDVQVTFADGTEATATVASTDAANDIAVLAPAGLPEVVVPAVLGGGVSVGDTVYAVGNPLGLVGSLSAGVVSATGRDVPVSETRTLSGLIQFDAAVNPGNSGGPLLNRAGQVVGVVTALANPAEVGYFVGIGFAVPIGTAGGTAGGPSQ